MATEYNNINKDIGSIENLTEYTWFNNKTYLDTFTSGHCFVFMTKPELFIYPQKPLNSNEIDKVLAYNNMCNDPKFTQYLISECHNKSDEYIIKQLSYERFDDIQSYFMPIITNSCKNADLLDITLDTSGMFNTRNGFNMILPTRTETSRAASQFQLRLTETHNLDILKIMNLWTEYIANIREGSFNANPTMVKNNVIDYMSTLYVFILDSDGRTIKTYGRYIGCYPLSVPLSPFSGDRNTQIEVEITIPFVYTYYEAMNPRILEDFNRISLKAIVGDANDNTDDISIGSVDYIPINNSQLLNKNLLFNGKYSQLLKNEKRDPIIYYEKRTSNNSVNPDELSGRFVLSFGINSMEDHKLKSIFDSNDMPNEYNENYRIFEKE